MDYFTKYGFISSFKEIFSDFENSLSYPNMLNKVIDNSFYNFYVSDGHGKTLFVNKAVEKTTGHSKEYFIGKNVLNLEKDGEFYPSAIEVALREQKEVTILQKLKNGEPAIVSAVPIWGENDKIEFVVTNGRCLNDENRLVDRQILEYINGQNQVTENTDIVYGSEKTKDLLALLNQVAAVDSTALILGESGVGKSMFAKYIHKQSGRATGNFVEICCGAIPEHLLESELFGYEAGAFSGASRTGKPGLIEMAEKGTLFLDEIGDMPLPLQVKLLSMLQERKIKRVGGIKDIDVDVRIISATNQNLEDLVSQGKFRKDLYYRINVVPVTIRPLRERTEDIDALLAYFLDKFNRKYARAMALNDFTMQKLREYSWPGNVRELQNYVERAVITETAEVITFQESDCRSDAQNILPKKDTEPSIFVKGIMPLPELIEEAEKQLIRNAYKLYPSSYKLASALQISQSLAHRKIKKYIP